MAKGQGVSGGLQGTQSRGDAEVGSFKDCFGFDPDPQAYPRLAEVIKRPIRSHVLRFVLSGRAELPDAVQDPLQVGPDLPRRESEHAQPARANDGITIGIVVPLLFVVLPVNLDHQTGLGAIEVGDESVNDLLAPKVKSVQTVGPEASPQGVLLPRHPTSESLGKVEFVRGNLLTVRDPELLHGPNVGHHTSGIGTG